MPVVPTNGTALYYETRGAGAPVLFIPGATGDGGCFARLAALLADEFTTVIYDRRGNSRSPAPAGWTQTSIEEQAADAAGLLTALGLERTVVVGTSGGGAIGLELVRRQPELVAGAIFHEPFLPHVLGEQWTQIAAQRRATFAPILASGGPRALMEAWLRAMRGEAGYQALDARLRERMLGNGQTYILEDAAYPRYHPAVAAVAAIRKPVQVLVGDAGAPWAPPMAAWLAGALGTAVVAVPGGHGAYLDEPTAFAAGLRPRVRQLTAAPLA